MVDAIFDLMHEDKRLSIIAGKKRIASLASVSANTVKNVLALVRGHIFSVTPTEYGDEITLLPDCRLQEFDPLLSILGGVIIGGQKTANDKNEYSPHKADDAFATGTSRYMKEQIRDWAQALDQTVPQVKADYTFPGLAEGVLLAYDTWQRVGDYTAQEYAEETGLKLSSVRGPLRRAEVMGLATTEREGSRGRKVYSFAPDFWQKIKELTPNLRTYKLSDQREARRLESAQQWTKAELEKAKEAGEVEKVKELDQRFKRQAETRIPHLVSLHPDLSMKEIERLAYDVAAYKRSPEQAAKVSGYRTQARNAHRQTVKQIASAVGDTLDAGVSKQDVLSTVAAQGFTESQVKAVLQSPRLMHLAATKGGNIHLRNNIAELRATGASERDIVRHLQFAGFIYSEISQALTANP